MKQVLQNLKSGEISVVDVPSPQLRVGGALVLTHASLISAGTERAKIELGEKSLVGKARARPELARQVISKARQEGLVETYRGVMQRLEAPSLLGYSAAGEVIAVGADCAGVHPGDFVSCGGGGYANHAEVNFVPKHLLARVPEGVSSEEAAYATLGAVALQGVRQGELRLGDRVVVIGLGLVGLLVVQLVNAAGGRVLAVDLEPEACSLAMKLGAELAVLRTGPVEATAEAFTERAGADAIFVCASTKSNDPIELAARLARDRGRVVVVGDVGMSLPREPFYEKELELRLSRSYGPGRYDPSYEEHGRNYPIGYVRWTEQNNIAEFLRLLAKGAVDVASLTTHRFEVERAVEAYRLISGEVADGDRSVGVLLTYPRSTENAVRGPIEVQAPSRRTSGHVGIGLVGAGSFATRILLPALAKDDRVQLIGVATSSGVSARHAAETFGFRYATSDIAPLLEDSEVDAIIIATRHNSHAALAAATVAAGKAVFCEKPLATSWKGLEEVAAAYSAVPVPLLVGFNRRFSPLTDALRQELPQRVPRSIVCRVNAGPLAPGHWVSDPIAGGGRIVGELCHFLDLACHLAEGRPLRVSAEALGRETPEPNDSVVVQVAFSCGSIASVQYLANGDPSVPKERIEVFCGGGIYSIDDFRSLEIIENGRRRFRRFKRQEKGHREEMRAFVDLVEGRDMPILSPEAVFLSSALTLQVLTALRLGRSVAVDVPEALGGRGCLSNDASPDDAAVGVQALAEPQS